MDDQTEKLLQEFNRAFNRHDVDAMMRLMTEDCLFENTFPPPDGERYAGQAAVRAFWEKFFEASPQAHIEIEETFSDGEGACQRWVYSWGGSSPGYVRGVDVFHLRGGRIAGKFSYVKG
jgi:ketosteroid isomerase-like protein